MNITYSECVFAALGFQPSACAILSSVACQVLQYFSTLSHKRHDLKKLLDIKYVFFVNFLYNFFLVKYPLFLWYFKKTLIHAIYFRISTQISNFMKIHPVGAELFNADRQTDGRTDGRDKVDNAFRKFCEKHLKTAERHIIKNDRLHISFVISPVPIFL